MTTITDTLPCSASGDIALLRCCVAIHQPNEISFGMGARGRQICLGKNARHDFPFAVAADEKQHLARRGQCRERQGHARNERLEAGSADSDDPTTPLLKLSMAGEERSRMPIWADPQQHDVE